MIGGSSLGTGWNFSLHHCVQTGSWGPPSLLSNGYQELFPWGWSGRGVKLTTHFHLVPRSRIRGAIPPLHQYAFTARFSLETQGQLYLYIPNSTSRRLKRSNFKYLIIWHILNGPSRQEQDKYKKKSVKDFEDHKAPKIPLLYLHSLSLTL
jgi:hypothetical protein